MIMKKSIRTREIEILESNKYPLFESMGQYLVVLDGFPIKGFKTISEADNYIDHLIEVNKEVKQ